MPGISLRYGECEREESVRRSLNSLIYHDSYKSEVIFNNNIYFFGSTRYSDYPVQIFDDGRLLIILEGRIYDKDQSSLEREVRDLVVEILANGMSERSVPWLLERDGDFVIYALDKLSQKCIVVNDILGRLPVYYYKDSNEIIISRESEFILGLIKQPSPDIMGIAQSLLFNYPLGERTLIENVCRLQPATLITINGSKCSFRVENFYVFDFEHKISEANTKKATDELVTLFASACKRRISPDNHNILSLSGGRDSRAVAAALQQNDISFLALTFLDYDKRYSSDHKIANRLSDTLKIRWEGHSLDAPNGSQVDRLLRMKNGLNYLAMSFVIEFLEKIRTMHGPQVICYSGEGGDKVLPSLNPQRKFRDINHLVNYIISANKIFPLSETAAITGIPKEEIIKEIIKIVSRFPENDLNHKYVHFIIYQRATKWLFEGEDRNRYYFWTVTPFYSVPFFKYAMACDDRLKSYDSLFTEFLIRLLPSARAIGYAGHGKTLTLFGKCIFDIKRDLKTLLRGSLLFSLAVRAKHLSYNRKSNTIRCMREQIETCEPVTRFLSYSRLARVIANCASYHKISIDNLFTVVSLIEKLYCHSRTIIKYRDQKFS